MINIIKDNNLDQVNASSYAVIDFSATWCGPCKMIAPLLEELSEEMAGEVDFFSCDVDQNPALASKFFVTSIPCLVVLKNGEKINQTVGFQPKDAIKQFILEKK